MSKYDEIVELAKQASADIRDYQRESIVFVETLASEWANYLETDVKISSTEDALASTPTKQELTTLDALNMREDGFWDFALALTLFPPLSELAIPLLFRKSRDGYKLKIANDSQNKTFTIKQLESNAFTTFFDYLFSSIQDYYRSFKNVGESKPILGFNATRLLKTSELPTDE
jgi:hypothetical protein